MSENNKNTAENGKGDAPRNNFSQAYRSNYEAIVWKKNKTKKQKQNQYPQIRGN
jgi:hypothetical protein